MAALTETRGLTFDTTGALSPVSFSDSVTPLPEVASGELMGRDGAEEVTAEGARAGQLPMSVGLALGAVVLMFGGAAGVLISSVLSPDPIVMWEIPLIVLVGVGGIGLMIRRMAVQFIDTEFNFISSTLVDMVERTDRVETMSSATNLETEDADSPTIA